MTNCPNCGAPIENTTCPYCGTIIYDFVNLDTTGRKPTWLRLNLNGDVVLAKAYPTLLETRFEQNTIECSTLGEPQKMYISSPDITLSMEFSIVPNDDGEILTMLKRQKG